MSDLFIVLGLLIGGIGGLIIAVIFCINHLTRIIGIIAGAIHYYFVYHVHLDMGANFVGGLLMGLSILDLFAIILAIYELNCLIKCLIEGDIGPSPSSHAMGGLASWISSFFR